MGAATCSKSKGVRAAPDSARSRRRANASRAANRCRAAAPVMAGGACGERRELSGKRDGLVHVSQMKNERVKHPGDVVSEGDEVFVKLLGFDDRGKVRLSMKIVDQDSGEEITKDEEASEEA